MLLTEMRFIGLCLLLLVLSVAPAAYPKGTSGARSGSRSYGSSRVFSSRRTTTCAGCARDSRGRIERSPKAKAEFQKANPCPSNGARSGGCKGYVVDHIKPLKAGGIDAPFNMQWQTKAEAKAKDRTE